MLPACRTADEPFAIPQYALTRSDIDSFMEELRGFHTAFQDCFARQEPRDQFLMSLSCGPNIGSKTRGDSHLCVKLLPFYKQR
jgi:hypothetical protein